MKRNFWMAAAAVCAAMVMAGAASAVAEDEAVAAADVAAAPSVAVTTVDGSELIGKVAYDAAASVLYVQMTFSSDWYGYEGVPADVAEAFLAAESKGAYFNTEIKGKYPVKRWEQR